MSMNSRVTLDFPNSGRRYAAWRNSMRGPTGRISCPIETRLSGLWDGLLFVLVTIGAKPMRWFGSVAGWLEGINKTVHAGMLKFVLAGVLLPFFMLYYLASEFFARIQGVLILRLQKHHFGLQVDDKALKLYRSFVDLDFRLCFTKSLRSLFIQYIRKL